MYRYLFLEYVWIDGYDGVRSKTKILSPEQQQGINWNKPETFPEWNFDGSSTNQAPGDDSEVILKPVTVYHDPFNHSKYNKHLLLLCECYLPDGTPHSTNTRYESNKLFEEGANHEPMFGLELEFFVSKNGLPIGFPEGRGQLPPPQKNYYCGVGGDHAFGRQCIYQAANNCLAAGIKLTGINAEVAPSQWELQVCNYGIRASDDSWMTRYILQRTAESFGWTIDFHPKPVEGDWNGSGCHINFSTKAMREEGGKKYIMEAIEKLETKHDEHIQVYGKNNDLRLTGEHETCSINEFRAGVADRGASIRIPRSVEKTGKGYFEDRRPASNVDPYLATAKIFSTTTLFTKTLFTKSVVKNATFAEAKSQEADR